MSNMVSIGQREQNKLKLMEINFINETCAFLRSEKFFYLNMFVGGGWPFRGRENSNKGTVKTNCPYIFKLKFFTSHPAEMSYIYLMMKFKKNIQKYQPPS